MGEVAIVRKPYRMQRKLRRALDKLVEGHSQREAALLAGMSDRGLSQALARPAVEAELKELARSRLTGQLPLAASTIERVQRGDNMQAALNGARLVLSAHGLVGAEAELRPSVSINLGPGVVIRLDRDPPRVPREVEGQVIDQEAGE